MKILITAALSAAFIPAFLYAAEPSAPADKKAESVKAGEAKPAKHDCADCPMHKKEVKGKKCPMADKEKKAEAKMCPGHMEGVEKAVKNIDNGVEITLTSKDKEKIAKIQEHAASSQAGTGEKSKTCPCRMEGAEIKSENLPDGAKLVITGKTPGLAKKIQEAAAMKHGGKEGAAEKAAKKYNCPMKCPGSESDKPGKCPKCGMPLAEKK